MMLTPNLTALKPCDILVKRVPSGSWPVTYLRDQSWLCVFCWCQNPDDVWVPRWAITRPQATFNMMTRNFFSIATNILLIKITLKIESRPIAVSVVMSPHNLGARIAVASTPCLENARATFCGRQSVWNRTEPDQRHLLGDNSVDNEGGIRLSSAYMTHRSCANFKCEVADVIK